MTYSTNVTSKGQVTIPVSIRRKLGIKAGQPVRFVVGKNGQVILQKNDWKHDLRHLAQEVASHLPAPLSDEQLDALIDAAASGAATERSGRAS